MQQKAINLGAVALLLLLFFAFLLAQGPSVAGARNDNANTTNNTAAPSPPAKPAAATAAGPFSFAEPTIRLAAGLQDGTAEIILRSSTQQTGPPTLKDVDLPRPLAAVVTFEQIPDNNAPANTWRYKATVYGLAPASSQQHYAVVTSADNKTQTLLYTLTNQPAGSFSWSLSKLPDPWVFSEGLTGDDGACTAFTVTAKDASATNVTVSSTLVEQSTKEAITLDSLRLCNSSNKCDGKEPITLQANVPTALQLCTTKTFHGTFHGSVILASREKPDGDTILQNAQFSSCLAKLIGFGLILLGVALAFLAKVWARARLERNQALVPVTLMRTQLKALDEALGQLKPDYRDVPTDIKAAIKKLLDELADNVLDSQHFLPPRFPNPFGFTVEAAGFKTYLEARNPRIQLLSIFVNKGVIPAVNKDNGTLTKAQRDAVKTAIRNIDAIVNTTPADQALPLVQGIVAALQLTLFPPPPNVIQPQVAFVPEAASSSFEALQLEIQSISKAIWVLYGILTAVSGLAVLILNNPGYGVPLDYIFAIFWGFGLPTMVQSLTPGSAASALNISIAKS